MQESRAAALTDTKSSGQAYSGVLSAVLCCWPLGKDEAFVLSLLTISRACRDAAFIIWWWSCATPPLACAKDQAEQSISMGKLSSIMSTPYQRICSGRNPND